MNLAAVFTSFFCFLVVGEAAAAQRSPEIERLAKELSGNTQCVHFSWVPGGGSPYGAMTIPATINGRIFRLQLDTGADTSILYGHLAQDYSWAGANAKKFFATHMSIGALDLPWPEFYLLPGSTPDADASGTLGLEALIGRVSIIDYANKNFCVLDPASVPTALAAAKWADASLRNGKLFLPIATDHFRSEAIIFDTGAGPTPLNVDIGSWSQITSRDVSEATTTIHGTAWGKPFALQGAVSDSELRIGEIHLGYVTTYTRPDTPTAYAQWPFKAEGVLGNQSFEAGAVILDLTDRVRFGIIP